MDLITVTRPASMLLQWHIMHVMGPLYFIQMIRGRTQCDWTYMFFCDCLHMHTYTLLYAGDMSLQTSFMFSPFTPELIHRLVFVLTAYATFLTFFIKHKHLLQSKMCWLFLMLMFVVMISLYMWIFLYQTHEKTFKTSVFETALEDHTLN